MVSRRVGRSCGCFTVLSAMFGSNALARTNREVGAASRCGHPRAPTLLQGSETWRGDLRLPQDSHTRGTPGLGSHDFHTASGRTVPSAPDGARCSDGLLNLSFLQIRRQSGATPKELAGVTTTSDR